MPETSKPAPKRKPAAFKPPRPASKPTITPRRKSAPAKAPSFSSSSEDELQGPTTQDSPAATAPSGTEDPPPTIPPKLLTRILHHHFKDGDTKVAIDANELVGKYMETFVREAIARATYERSEAEGGGLGREFLEVEDLEKLAPQLLLDF